jgi:hypothetical protein
MLNYLTCEDRNVLFIPTLLLIFSFIDIFNVVCKKCTNPHNDNFSLIEHGKLE